jgi:hypothetical protein
VFEISHYFLREIMALMVTYTGQSYKLYWIFGVSPDLLLKTVVKPFSWNFELSVNWTEWF